MILQKNKRLLKSFAYIVKNRYGKKLNQADENIMKAAEKLLNEEIGKALGILPEEVPKYIESTLK